MKYTLRLTIMIESKMFFFLVQYNNAIAPSHNFHPRHGIEFKTPITYRKFLSIGYICSIINKLPRDNPGKYKINSEQLNQIF